MTSRELNTLESLAEHGFSVNFVGREVNLITADWIFFTFTIEEEREFKLRSILKKAVKKGLENYDVSYYQSDEELEKRDCLKEVLEIL